MSARLADERQSLQDFGRQLLTASRLAANCRDDLIGDASRAKKTNTA
jgi:hypothetical protein